MVGSFVIKQILQEKNGIEKENVPEEEDVFGGIEQRNTRIIARGRPRILYPTIILPLVKILSKENVASHNSRSHSSRTSSENTHDQRMKETVFCLRTTCSFSHYLNPFIGYKK
jgi:hypothetical protein